MFRVVGYPVEIVAACMYCDMPYHGAHAMPYHGRALLRRVYAARGQTKSRTSPWAPAAQVGVFASRGGGLSVVEYSEIDTAQVSLT